MAIVSRLADGNVLPRIEDAAVSQTLSKLDTIGVTLIHGHRINHLAFPSRTEHRVRFSIGRKKF